MSWRSRKIYKGSCLPSFETIFTTSHVVMNKKWWILDKKIAFVHDKIWFCSSAQIMTLNGGQPLAWSWAQSQRKMLSFATGTSIPPHLPSHLHSSSEIHRHINQSWLHVQKDRELDTAQREMSFPERLVTSSTHSMQRSGARASWSQCSQEPEQLGR